jgi:hypothetical protein
MGKSDDRLTPTWVAASSEDLMTTLWLGIHMLESKKFLAAFVAGDAKAAEIHLSERGRGSDKGRASDVT